MASIRPPMCRTPANRPEPRWVTAVSPSDADPYAQRVTAQAIDFLYHNLPGIIVSITLMAVVIVVMWPWIYRNLATGEYRRRGLLSISHKLKTSGAGGRCTPRLALCWLDMALHSNPEYGLPPAAEARILQAPVARRVAICRVGGAQRNPPNNMILLGPPLTRLDPSYMSSDFLEVPSITI